MVDTTNAEHYTWGQHCDGWHLVKDVSLSVIQEKMAPGAAEVRHRHAKAQQFFYVLQGEATLEVDGTEHILTGGQGITVPAGAPHQMFNRSSCDLSFLAISVPPSHGDRTPA
jgi:mannose-6-phosphate isomerase-like protein (cupin superfamily)